MAVLPMTMVNASNSNGSSRFAGRVVFVTGAGGGIGMAIATRFSSEGAKVVLADLQTEQVESIADRIMRGGGEALSTPLDVADQESVAAACAAAVERWGRLDVMVCNAGVRPVGSVLEQSTSQFELALRVNVTGVFLCGQAAARQMVKQTSGAIVNIASVNGFRAVTGMAAYNASKAAVVSADSDDGVRVGAAGSASERCCAGTDGNANDRRTSRRRTETTRKNVFRWDDTGNP